MICDCLRDVCCDGAAVTGREAKGVEEEEEEEEKVGQSNIAPPVLGEDDALLAPFIALVREECITPRGDKRRSWREGETSGDNCCFSSTISPLRTVDSPAPSSDGRRDDDIARYMVVLLLHSCSRSARQGVVVSTGIMSAHTSEMQ